MPLRTIFLRLMLWSLGLAAATGALAVLTQGGNLVGRLVGTGIATALACALMMPASLLIDRKQLRWAGLLCMAAVILEFLMALSLIWRIAQDLNVFIVDAETRITFTMVFLGLAVGAAMTCAVPLRTPRHAVAAKTALGLVTITFVAYLVAIWQPDSFRGHGSRSWGTANALAVLGLLTVPTLVGRSAGERWNWRGVGITASVAAWFMWSAEIWNPTGSRLGVVIFCALIGVGAVVAHANLCLVAVNLTSNQGWVRNGAITAAGATALLAVLVVTEDQFRGGVPIDAEIVGRFMEATGIIAACGTLALLVLARMNRKVDVEPGSIELAEIVLFCPRCRRKQSLSVGKSVCVSCGLRISIRVEEPRCANCDYLLRGLTSDRCPECGTPIGSPVAG